MALENTGTAFARYITVVKREDGAEASRTNHDVTNGIPGKLSAITPSQWVQLSVDQANDRYNAWLNHLPSLYGGVNIANIVTGSRTITDHTLCPLAKRSFTVTLQSENEAKGKVWGGGTVEEGGSVEVNVGTGKDYKLEGWYKNNVKVPNLQATDRYTPTENTTLVAKFVPSKEYLKIDLGPDIKTGKTDPEYYATMVASARKPVESTLRIVGEWGFMNGETPTGVDITNGSFNFDITIHTGDKRGECQIVDSYIAELDENNIYIKSATCTPDSDDTYTYHI